MREVGVQEVGAQEVEVREVGVQEVGAREVGAQEVGAQEVEAREAGAQEVEELGLENLHILLKTHIVSLLAHHSNCVRYQTYHLDISNLFLQIVLEHIYIPSS